ncbi:MAG TPA: hypothetical protein VF501_06130 [Thiobacillus sp.]
MKNGIRIAVMAGGLMTSGGAALGADKSADCTKAGAPEMVEGQVTAVDAGQGKLTLRASDGGMHEFQASKETLDDYKVGDPIKAKLRMGPKC